LDRDQAVERVVEVEALAAAELAGALVDPQVAVRREQPAVVAARQPWNGRDLGTRGRGSQPPSASSVSTCSSTSTTTW
jgi:hypothetical protein